MNCNYCGAQLPENVSNCPNCGAPVPQMADTNQPISEIWSPEQELDAPTGLKILSFIIPIAGLIIYFTEINNRPIRAKSCGKFALISIAIGLVFKIVDAIL